MFVINVMDIDCPDLKLCKVCEDVFHNLDDLYESALKEEKTQSRLWTDNQPRESSDICLARRHCQKVVEGNGDYCDMHRQDFSEDEEIEYDVEVESVKSPENGDMAWHPTGKIYCSWYSGKGKVFSSFAIMRLEGRRVRKAADLKADVLQILRDLTASKPWIPPMI